MQTLNGGKKLTVKQGLSAENKRHKAQKKQQGRDTLPCCFAISI